MAAQTATLVSIGVSIGKGYGICTPAQGPFMAVKKTPKKMYTQKVGEKIGLRGRGGGAFEPIFQTPTTNTMGSQVGLLTMRAGGLRGRRGG